MGASEDRIRVVLVSPSDVTKERDTAKAVIDELNRTVAADRMVLWRWETDARPGLHLEGPQGLLDGLMDIQTADVVVGVFWKRFGTPTREAGSGTEHELRRALATWHQHGHPQVMVYFSTRAYSLKSSDELAQWQQVLDFKGELATQQLWWEYTTPKHFERLLREHLTRYLLSTDRAPARHRSPAVAGRVRFNVPAVAASFTGREHELEQLEEVLGVKDRVVITQAITGLGGVGKSQLAARYAQQHGDDYDIVAWVAADDGGVADLAQLAVTLRASVQERSPSERAQLALTWLSETSRSWLLVLDNVESPAQLTELRPAGGNGRVLVTSRDRALRQFCRLITVDVFDEDTATRYLTDRADRSSDQVAARLLSGALGCLPLALSHAAAYCQDATTFSDYLALLQDLPARELFDNSPQESYEQTVASTWKASIQAANAAASLAGDVLQIAAYLAPTAIPKTLFSALIDDHTGRQRKRLADAFNALARYSLATVDDDSVSVHRLLQKTIREDNLAAGGIGAARNALRGVDEEFPSRQDTALPVQWPRCERLLAHVLALSTTFTDPGEHAATLIDVLNRACRYLYCAGARQRHLSTAKTIAGHAERLLKTEHPHTLTAYHNLALAYYAIGRPHEAITLAEPLLRDRERILGVEHPDTFRTRGNLALAYHTVGRSGQAIAIHESLLSDQERTLGAEHPDTLNTRHHLAAAYLASGRVDDAIAIYEPLLSSQERILGAEHPHTLRTRNNLAVVYNVTGRSGEAMAIYESLLSDRERVLGAKHPDTLNTRSHLAGVHTTAGRIDDAIAIYEPLLSDQERTLGAEHPDTLTTRHNLASAYQVTGRTHDAERLRRKA